MGFENASDSYADLLQIKQERESRQQQQQPEQPIGTGDVGAKRVSFRISTPRRKLQVDDHSLFSLEDFNCEQFVEENDDDCNWPMWEMTGENPWTENNDCDADAERNCNMTAAFTDSDGNVYFSQGETVNTQEIPSSRSIADCERIFTVPEVFDEMMERQQKQIEIDGTRDPSMCNFFSNCSSLFESHRKKNALVDNNETADGKNVLQLNQHTCMAVQLYTGMPATMRLLFTPSMYKVQVDEDDDCSNQGKDGERRRVKRASIVGHNEHIFSIGIENGIMTTSNHQIIGKAGKRNKNKQRVHFSELKRVLKIRKFNSDEATQVWFHREDFDHFKAEMTLLIRDREASKELAAIWLSEEAGWQKNDSLEKKEKLKAGIGTISNTKKSHTKNRSWWHDYHHSRRGLERYASPDQARQIFASYKVAVHKVLSEERRQRLFNCVFFCIPSNSARDAQRIAEIYHEYTAWSSDLALAAGASDADAVRTNFDDDTRKTREYYILKQIIANGYKVHKYMPQFMLPKCIIPRGFLDENKTLYGTNDLTTQNRLLSFTKPTMLIGAMRKSLLHGSSTGEQAREEMSNLNSIDMAGPIAPALAVILKVKEDGSEEDVSGTLGIAQHSRSGKIITLASKAKNFPFQQ